MATLKVTRRTGLGTHKVQKLRTTGMVPGIIYGHKEEPIPVAVEQLALAEAIHQRARLLELDLEGTPQNVLIKQVQYDSLGSTILHVDLTRVRLDERVQVTVPLLLRGKLAATEEGGVITQLMPNISIECLVTAIPEDIRFAVTALKIGESVKASQLTLPPGAKLLIDPEALVCTVSLVMEAEVAAPVEGAVGAAEPEVIREKKEEGEEGEGAEKPKAEKPKAEKAKAEKKE
jgi:large subunit ribosomal protein L25